MLFWTFGFNYPDLLNAITILILLNNHINTVKIKIQTDIEKKKRSFKFFKKTHFVHNFLIHNISKFGDGDFLVSGPKIQNRISNWEKPTIFTVIPCVLQWRNRLEPILKGAVGSYKYPVCLEPWKFATKVVLYFHNINKSLFRRIVKNSLYSSAFYSLNLELSPSRNR